MNQKWREKEREIGRDIYLKRERGSEKTRVTKMQRFSLSLSFFLQVYVSPSFCLSLSIFDSCIFIFIELGLF